MENKFDVAVIGSGPGGYVAAIRAAQLGLKVACIEKAELGGICLNWGCIPTKAILRNADLLRNFRESRRFGISYDNMDVDFSQVIKRSRDVAFRLSKGVEFLLKKNNIAHIKGFARLKDKNKVVVESLDGEIQAEVIAESIVIATGARSRSIPGVEIDGRHIITSKEALILDEVPKSIIIVGAGAIGVEFGYIYCSFGSEVTLVEMLPRILPLEDEEISAELTKAFKKQRINIFAEAKVRHAASRESSVDIQIEIKDGIKNLTAEYALIATGVQGNVENMGLEPTGIKIEKSWIKVNENYETNVPGVYAIGDVIGPPWLAHVASAEGIYTAEHIAGLKPTWINYNAIPGCTFCKPQVASVGFTEKRAREKGIEVRIGKFPFRANGKSLASGEIDGFVKVIFDSETDRLIGAHIIGNEATELITELTLAITNKMTFDELNNSIHAHPTLSEAVMEAIEDAYGRAIHK